MKKFPLIIATLSFALVLTISFSAFQTVNARKSERMIYSSYNKTFYELIENIEKIDLALSKAALASDSHSLLSYGDEIRTCAAFAISDLGEMESDSPLFNINTFLNQSGDYVKSVALSHSDGSSPTKAEQDSFLALSRYSKVLKEELNSLRDKIASGDISYSSALKKADETLGNHLSRIENEHFSSYESMNYDGAFSSHMESIASTYLSSLPEISKEDALEKALHYLSGNVPLVYSGESKGVIPSYMFYYDTDLSQYSMELSKNGGQLLYYSESRPINDAVIRTEDAVFHALKFSENAGYPYLTPVFYENSGGILTVTLAPLENDVIYYTDIIKVEIALDTASVVGFNAEDYLLNHKERTFPDLTVAYDSLSKTNKDFILKAMKKAYIPSNYGTENACLEALGLFDDKTFLIYINAETGFQEEILLLSENDYEYLAK